MHSPIKRVVNLAWHCRDAMALALTFLLLTGTVAGQWLGYPLPSIIVEPNDASVAVGETAAVFGVAASDFPFGGTVTYQWRKEGRAVSGATSNVFTVVSARYSDAGSYDVVVTGKYGSVTSRVVRLTVVLPFAPSIVAQPADVVAIQGSTARFSVTASALPRPTYQWRKDGIAVAGASTSTFTLASVVLADAGTYDVVISNSQGTVSSRGASLVVALPPIAITQQPIDVTLELGQSTALTVVATATSSPPRTILYRWRKDGQNIPGATAATLRLPNVQLEDSGDYDAILYFFEGLSAGWVATNPAKVRVVIPYTIIVSQPASLSVSAGDRASFSVGARGVNLSFQWRKNGEELPGATTSELIIARSTAERDIGYYSVIVRGTYGAVESNAASLFVVPSPYLRFAGALGQRGFVDGDSESCRFDTPWGIAVDPQGNVVVAENQNGVVREISTAGKVSTIAGAAGLHGYLDGPAPAARFASPTGLAIDAAGTIYVGDNGNGVVRQIVRGGGVSTLGDGRAPFIRGVGGVCVDGFGNVYVTDYANHTLLKFDLHRNVTVLAGRTGVSGKVDAKGADARFNSPFAVAVDSRGTLYLSDDGNRAIRKVSPDGTVTTVPNLESSPCLAIDRGDALLLAAISERELRRITATGAVVSLSQPFTAYGNAATGMFFPRGLAADAQGNLYLADTSNQTVLQRRMTPPTFAPARFTNLSARGTMRAGGALTLGFSLRGEGAQPVLVRAIGPGLRRWGVTGALADPSIDVVAPGRSLPLVANDNWELATRPDEVITATNRVGAFGLEPRSLDAAAIATLHTAESTAYTARITATNSTMSGIVLGEIYDAGPLTTSIRLSNLSALGFCGAGDDALIAGLAISGRQPKRVLFRAVGPSLREFGVQAFARGTQMTVYPAGMSAMVARNVRWGESTATRDTFLQAGAFPLPLGSSDSAVLTELLPGAYTVVVNATDQSGFVLIEVYDLDP